MIIYCISIYNTKNIIFYYIVFFIFTKNTIKYNTILIYIFFIIYFSYDNYNQVKNKLRTCNYNYNNEERARFNKIISSITKHNFIDWKDNFFSCLHHYLTYNNGHMGFGVDYYCRYINLWLNREVRKTGYEGYQQHFNIFKDFVHNYADAKQGNYTDSCKEYIYLMDDKEYNRINFLYNFYDMYNNLKSKNYPFTTDECDNLFRNTANYKVVIDDYYKNHRDLYDKISHVKNLIEKIVKEPPKKCDNILNFSIPLQFLEDEKKRKQEEAEKQKQQAEEAERQKQKADEAERERRQQEDELEAKRRRIPPRNITIITRTRKFKRNGEIRGTTTFKSITI
ncbi:hypothetical protein PVMG_06204 [Plasmodium vivax Mauritania I]|uniref:Uncharacterized protein n=1 Tax=Plasmodium vivax Mauritania I TaxID=1035515 RepID=A0A0J9T3H7_PLAVI|nr:hypothetical protein PVMG_06204 [Plasmodium vivax Mauritania I]